MVTPHRSNDDSSSLTGLRGKPEETVGQSFLPLPREKTSRPYFRSEECTTRGEFGNPLLTHPSSTLRDRESLPLTGLRDESENAS